MDFDGRLVLVRNKNEQTGAIIWDICTLTSQGELTVWTSVLDELLYDAGARENRLSNKIYLDFKIVEA